MDKLEMTFQVEMDTKNTGRYQEEAGSSRPHRYAAAEKLQVLGGNLRSEIFSLAISFKRKTKALVMLLPLITCSCNTPSRRSRILKISSSGSM